MSLRPSIAADITLRPWRDGDQDALVRIGDDREIWLNLRDAFPHPYTRADADRWIAFNLGLGDAPRHFAIMHAGEPIGGIGFDPLPDVHRLTAEIGYWLGRPHWGQGLATRALALASDHAFSHFSFERLQAAVFDWNPASARVLQKCGYLLEGRLRRSVYKDGRFCDSLLYARLK